MVEYHTRTCPLNGTGREHTDAAKRLSDTYRLHRLADPIGNLRKWFAVSMDDGTGDHILYDTKEEAQDHQHHNEEWMIFTQIVPADMPQCDAEVWVNVNRKMFDQGMPLGRRETFGGRTMIARLSMEDFGAQMRSILRGSPPSNIRWKGIKR